MILWDQFVDVLRESMIAYAQICHGNLGYGILVVTCLARLALLPIGIRLAKAARVHQQVMERIQPQLDALRARHKGNARRLAEETERLMAREGISIFQMGGLLGTLAQTPVFIALYLAVRRAAMLGGRLWWIRDVSKPDAVLAVMATIFTVAASVGTPATSPNRNAMLIVSGIVTVLALSNMAAGIGLHVGLSSLFGAVPGLVARSRARSNA